MPTAEDLGEMDLIAELFPARLADDPAGRTTAAQRPPPAEFGTPRRGRAPKYFIPGTQQPVTKYLREKALGLRRENGAMHLKKLTPRHLQMVNMQIAGMSMEEIATAMRVSLSTVWKVVTDPLAKQYLRNIYEARQQELDSLLGRTTDAVRSALTTGTTKEKLQAVSAYAKLKQVVAPETNPAQTAEDVATAIVAKASNIQMNFYGEQ